MGDGLYDLNQAIAANGAAPDYPIYRVRGNCDIGSDDPAEGLAPFGGVLFFYTHGHLFGVKSGYERIAEYAADRGADVVLFGHTHYKTLRHGTPFSPALFNPGSLRDTHSYGVITITDGQCSFEWKQVPGTMVNDAVISHNSVNELYYLEEVDSTNTWAKANLDKFGPVGAVYTTSQTAGRGRRGHTWINASGQALYYTVVLKTELAQPESLPLFASMAVADALEQRYGIQCQIKWPNDLLLNGKKIVGILCEGMPDHHAIVCGIGINLAQPQSYFDAMELPHGTSLALQGIAVDPAADAAALAESMTNFGFDRALYGFEREGFSAIRDAYKARCVNLGRHVTFDGGEGTALDVDEEGRLVVQGAEGSTHVFTGEVSVHGIYGAV